MLAGRVQVIGGGAPAHLGQPEHQLHRAEQPERRAQPCDQLAAPERRAQPGDRPTARDEPASPPPRLAGRCRRDGGQNRLGPVGHIGDQTGTNPTGHRSRRREPGPTIGTPVEVPLHRRQFGGGLLPVQLRGQDLPPLLTPMYG